MNAGTKRQRFSKFSRLFDTVKEMSGRWLRTLVLLAAVLMSVGTGLARAAQVGLDQLAATQLVPSSVPTLLGPIDALGRNGWDCAPEKAAKAFTVKDAELPDNLGR
jgi:hypothetical protein